MKKIKIGIWFVILLIIQTTIAHYIRIFDVTPVFILPFAVGVMLLESEFSYAVGIGAICSIFASCFLGRNFFLSAVIVMLFSVLTFNLRMKPRYMHTLLKMIIWTSVITLVWETLSHLMLYRSFELYKGVIFPQIFISVIYNAVIACIIYPILKNTVYKDTEKPRLIVI